MNRGILIEMAVYTENDVYSMKPVANISSEETAQIEGQEYKMFVWKYISSQSINPKYTIDIQSIGTIYSHHCVGRRLKKASILALPQVLNADLVTAPWRIGHNKKEKTGMVSAPILIDDIKYLMNITLTRNNKNIIKPYAITLKDNNGEITNEVKVINNISVHDSNNGNSTFGNDRLSTITTSQDANTPLPSNAKIKHSNEINKKLNENMNMSKIRLTEAQLHQVIKESVNKITKQEYEFASDDFNKIADKIYDARQEIGNLKWKTQNYEPYAFLYPTIEKIEDLLNRALRLSEPQFRL